MIEAKAVPYEKKMTVGKVVSFVFAKVFKEFSAVGQWLLVTLLVGLVNAIPLGLIIASLGFNAQYIPTTGAYGNPFENANLGLMVSGAILMLVVLIADIVYGIFTIAWFNRLGLDAFDGIKRVFGERFKLAMKETWRLLAPILLLALFGIVIMIPYYVVNAVDTANVTMNMAYGEAPFLSAFSLIFSSPLATIFYFAAIIATVYISVKTVAVYGILLENREVQVMEGFKKSFEMTKGRGWRIFGYAVALVLLLILVYLAVVILFVIIWFVVGVSGFGTGIIAIAAVLSILIYVTFISFVVGARGFFTAAVYKYLMIEHSEDLPPEVGPENHVEDQLENQTEDEPNLY